MFNLSNIEILHIELTNQCNAACPACARNVQELKFNSKLHRTEITLDQFKKLFDIDLLKNLKKILFCGDFGDPIAAKDLLDIIEYVKNINSNLTIGINTNGGARNTEWWIKLAKLLPKKEDYVVWSIDGLKDTNHIYRVNTEFDKILKNAQAFINAGGNAQWDMLVFDYNEHQIAECEKLAKELGFKWFRSKVSIRHEIKFYNDAFDRKPKIYQAQEGITHGKIDCMALNEKSIYITAHGTALPCCILGDRIYHNYIINSHKDLLPKEKLNLSNTNINKVIPLFNQVVDTWQTDTPADTCKLVCNRNQSGHKFHKMWVTETEF